MRLLIVVVIVAAAGLCPGCSNPINAYTAGHYFEAAERAEAAGDLAQARMLYSRAAGNADMGNLGANAQAHTWYEYARLPGYLGEVDEAQRTFDRVLKLIDAGGAPTESLRAPALAEYARMLQNNGRPRDALPLYARALDALNQTSVGETDPIGFALFLDNHAACLRSAGDDRQAGAIADRAAQLRREHPGEKAKFTNAHLYASAGRAASQRGDWTTAARYWALAAEAADAGSESPRFVAIAHYEHGRSLGVTGQFEQGERELKHALKIDAKNGGETYMDLTELGRLNQAQGRYADAIGYFEKEMPIMNSSGAAKRAPLEMVAFLTDYADCLRHAGRTADADRVSQRAATLSSTAPAGAPPADRTPYGSLKPSQPKRD
jgi:tetratricopeptide (TPR) repeat protein